MDYFHKLLEKSLYHFCSHHSSTVNLYFSIVGSYIDDIITLLISSQTLSEYMSAAFSSCMNEYASSMTRQSWLPRSSTTCSGYTTFKSTTSSRASMYKLYWNTFWLNRVSFIQNTSTASGMLARIAESRSRLPQHHSCRVWHSCQGIRTCCRQMEGMSWCGWVATDSCICRRCHRTQPLAHQLEPLLVPLLYLYTN